MGQLRDWWPSEDALVKRSSAVPPNITLTHSSPPLQLLEAAAALNDDVGPACGAFNNQNYPYVPSSAPQVCPRPPIKLINSQDHKQELLRNLLNQRATDLPQQAQAISPSLSPQDNTLVNPRLPGSFAHLLQQVHSKPSPSSSQQDDMSLTLFRKGTSPTPFTTSIYHPSDESLKLERSSGGSGAHELQQRLTNSKDSSPSEKARRPNLIGKEALTSENSHNLRGSLYKDGMEKSCSSHSVEKHPEKMRNLHEVQEHPINKDSLSRREIHIYSERQRRKGMTHLYTTLLSLLPGAKPKTDRCKVLTDAMDYIQILREQVEVLGSQKAELVASLTEQEGDHHNTDYTSGADGEAANSSTITGISDEAKDEILSSADVAVRFCGREAFITLNSCKSKGVWSGILQILHEQELDIFNVTLSSGNEMDHHCIHARVTSSWRLLLFYPSVGIYVGIDLRMQISLTSILSFIHNLHTEICLSAVCICLVVAEVGLIHNSDTSFSVCASYGVP
ncbi:hypothetical protein GOP47_0010417 [Adiantum capillus-veneris]|uniref:BHLH domain-containing protein n=1 Tax=Adiantum capillus-veneris TaxID=13818 RepID=A0A9D4ZIQ9_ADICA|nr:hypothetical protein GOP47_0010417 [Adiantum capillus-veneris]